MHTPASPIHLRKAYLDLVFTQHTVLPTTLALQAGQAEPSLRASALATASAWNCFSPDTYGAELERLWKGLMFRNFLSFESSPGAISYYSGCFQHYRSEVSSRESHYWPSTVSPPLPSAWPLTEPFHLTFTLCPFSGLKAGILGGKHCCLFTAEL